MLVKSINGCGNCPVCGGECQSYRMMNDGIPPCDFWDDNEDVYAGKYVDKYLTNTEETDKTGKKVMTKAEQNKKWLRESKYLMLKSWVENCDMKVAISKKSENKVYMKYTTDNKEKQRVRFCYDLDSDTVSMSRMERNPRQDFSVMYGIKNQFGRYMEKKTMAC